MSIIQTFSGELVDLTDPQPHQIHLEDIAHSLSHLCRFTGHVRTFYSVAQHSWVCCEVSMAMPGRTLEDHREALLHDASEAYLGDVSSPLKGIPAMAAAYRPLEILWMRAIAERFDMRRLLSGNVSPGTKGIDIATLMSEAEAGLPGGPHPDAPWPHVPPFARAPVFAPWPPPQARMSFMSRAHLLGLG